MQEVDRPTNGRATLRMSHIACLILEVRVDAVVIWKIHIGNLEWQRELEYARRIHADRRHSLPGHP